MAVNDQTVGVRDEAQNDVEICVRVFVEVWLKIVTKDGPYYTCMTLRCKSFIKLWQLSVMYYLQETASNSLVLFVLFFLHSSSHIYVK